MIFGDEGDRCRLCRAMTLEIGHDRVALAFVTVEVDIGDLDKATKVAANKDITRDGD